METSVPQFEKIKAIKIYENIDILENYSNKKNENNVAWYKRKTACFLLDFASFSVYFIYFFIYKKVRNSTCTFKCLIFLYSLWGFSVFSSFCSPSEAKSSLKVKNDQMRVEDCDWFHYPLVQQSFVLSLVVNQVWRIIDFFLHFCLLFWCLCTVEAFLPQCCP